MRRLVISLLPLFALACGGNGSGGSGGSGVSVDSGRGGSGGSGHAGSGGSSESGGSGGSSSAGSGGSGQAGSGGSGGSSATGGSTGTEADASSGDDSAAESDADSTPAGDASAPNGDAAPPPLGAVPGTHPIFDGTTLTGWDGNPSIWSVKDGAIHGITQNGGQLIKSKDTYDNFRIVGSARMLGTDLSQHMGICIWGSPAAAGNWGYSGCIEFTPGSGSYWDYGKCGAKNQLYTFATKPVWSQFEILANLTTKKVRVAINGHEVPGYTDCANSGHKKGPIGLQIHAHASEVEYKDLAIDPNPTMDALLTVKP